MKNKIYPFDVEYFEEVHKILNEGGVLWLIERTDTHEFLVAQRVSDVYSFTKTEDVWLKEIPVDVLFTYTTDYYFLTKEDAEEYSPKQLTEGGCRHCYHGALPIPIQITEHEFVGR